MGSRGGSASLNTDLRLGTTGFFPFCGGAGHLCASLLTFVLRVSSRLPWAELSGEESNDIHFTSSGSS